MAILLGWCHAAAPFDRICQHWVAPLVYVADGNTAIDTIRGGVSRVLAMPLLFRMFLLTRPRARISAQARRVQRVGIGRCRAILTLLAIVVLPMGAVAETEMAETELADAASVAPDASVLKIATREVPPFAMRTDDGSWQGIAIDLWRRVAERQGLSYELVELDLSRMIETVAAGEVDAVVAALTITSERERRVDFSHPYHHSGLGIAVAQRPGGSLLATMKRLFSGRFLNALGALLALLTVVGILIWLAERRRNQQFQGGAMRGIGSGLWWSAVTMTTVGYGDKAPATLLGRAIAMVWMFASIIVISSFTAAIATALTISELDRGIRDLDDLRRARVETLAESTSADFLDQQRLRYKGVSSLPEALERLVGGDIDAVVYDAPILRFLINSHYHEDLQVLPQELERQDYGIALPQQSPLREPINTALLEAIRAPDWRLELERYLGKR